MKIELTKKQFRRLLDMAYIGNWILNSARGKDRFDDYDEVESLLFSRCIFEDMPTLVDVVDGVALPSKLFIEGGIHEAIMDYEDTVFYGILAEELARRDMSRDLIDQGDTDELDRRVEEYITEFEANGMENLNVEN